MNVYQHRRVRVHARIGLLARACACALARVFTPPHTVCVCVCVCVCVRARARAREERRRREKPSESTRGKALGNLRRGRGKSDPPPTTLRFSVRVVSKSPTESFRFTLRVIQKRSRRTEQRVLPPSRDGRAEGGASAAPHFPAREANGARKRHGRTGGRVVEKGRGERRERGERGAQERGSAVEPRSGPTRSRLGRE